MRDSVVKLVIILFAGTSVSCASLKATSTGGNNGSGDKNASVVVSEPVLRLTLPPGAKGVEDGGMFTVTDAGGNFRFFVWTVENAKTLDEAVSRVPDVIKGEFRDFKFTETKELTVAGAPARQLTGTGTEADDGDPGNAAVVLFTVGDHIFAACVHGEGKPSEAILKFMLNTIQTAKAP
jgi:hypothetical protein